MIQLKKILVPVDFSSFSLDALEYGCELASRFGAEVHLFYVVSDALLMYTAAQTMVDAEAVICQEKEQGRKKLEQAVPEKWQGKITFHHHVEVGEPVAEIIKFADSLEADLLVMGTHGRTGLKHILLGSVAEKVVRGAHLPVMTVNDPDHHFVHP